MERISLEKLQVLLIETLDADYKEIALIGPIIHQFDDEYYNAAITYISTGKKTVIEETYLTPEKVENGLKCDYLEALCVLNNIKKFPKQVDFIMHFDVIE